jgi:hypothetical protein
MSDAFIEFKASHDDRFPAITSRICSPVREGFAADVPFWVFDGF